MWLHFSIVHNAPITIYNFFITPEPCLQSNKTGKIEVTQSGVEIDVEVYHGLNYVT